MRGNLPSAHHIFQYNGIVQSQKVFTQWEELYFHISACHFVAKNLHHSKNNRIFAANSIKAGGLSYGYKRKKKANLSQTHTIRHAEF